MRQRNDETVIDHRTRLALRYLEDNHGVSSEYIRIVVAHTNPNTGVSHVYARQTAGGVDVLDGVANVNIDKHGRIISSSQTFAPVHQVRRAMRASRRLAARSPSDSLKKALKTLCNRVKLNIDDEVLKMVYISMDESDQGQAPKFTIKGVSANSAVDGVATAQHSIMQGTDGTLIPVWDFFLQQPDHSWSARINMATGDIETLVDRRLRSYRSTGRRRAVQDDGPSAGGVLKKRLSYLVVPITKQDPRDGFDFIVNPETSSSPTGWVYTNTTSGNNVIAYRGEQEDVAKETSPDTFAYYHDETASPTTAQNIGAALTNVFYVVNSLHDIFYIYGFTEVTFNFQDDNFGKGGLGNDRVLASVQDNSDINNADFFTPPDGQNGHLRVHLFDLTNPQRDGGLENDIIAHVYGKGASKAEPRRDCLRAGATLLPSGSCRRLQCRTLPWGATWRIIRPAFAHIHTRGTSRLIPSPTPTDRRQPKRTRLARSGPICCTCCWLRWPTTAVGAMRR
jgi:extracellular elastinolytic metalloproteinase